MAGRVVMVNTSERCAGPKIGRLAGELVAGQGLRGDAEFGQGKCEVRLLALESIWQVFHTHGVMALPGCFGEHLTTEGIDLLDLAPGMLLSVGDALLQVERVGDAPELERNYRFRHVALLPHEGVLCRVLASGRVTRGDSIRRLPHSLKINHTERVGPTEA